MKRWLWANCHTRGGGQTVTPGLGGRTSQCCDKARPDQPATDHLGAEWSGLRTTQDKSGPHLCCPQGGQEGRQIPESISKLKVTEIKS